MSSLTFGYKSVTKQLRIQGEPTYPEWCSLTTNEGVRNVRKKPRLRIFF